MKLFLDIWSNYDGAYTAGFMLGILLVALTPFVFYLITLQNTLKSVHQLNRMMTPGKVWLLFVPLVNLVWMFIVVSRMADSIQNELNARGEVVAQRPTYGIGLAWCILYLCSLVLRYLPGLSGLCTIAFLVCWIIHWIKVNEYRKKFLAEPYEPNAESQIFGHI